MGRGSIMLSGMPVPALQDPCNPDVKAIFCAYVRGMTEYVIEKAQYRRSVPMSRMRHDRP